MQCAILAFVIVAATLTVYAPVKQHPFIHIDDYGYVVEQRPPAAPELGDGQVVLHHVSLR